MNVIITGATKGIGKACSLYFASKGFDVIFCARTEHDIFSLKSEIEQMYSVKVHAIACDLSLKSDVKKFGEFCLAVSSEFDVLINNAGIFLSGGLLEEEDGNLETLIEINIYSAYYLTRMIAPEMIKNKQGHIFNLCSVASLQAYESGGSYTITKFGLLGFSKSLRNELKHHFVKVTAVLPGAVLTQSWEGTELPEERFIDVNEVAKLIWNAYDTSQRTVVEEILIRPMLGDI